MTFSPTKPCRTQSHLPVTILYWDDEVILARCGEMAPITLLYHRGGSPQRNDMRGRYDLINIPEEHEVMVYFQKDGVTSTNIRETAIASKRIKFTEGEFEE